MAIHETIVVRGTKDNNSDMMTASSIDTYSADNISGNVISELRRVLQENSLITRMYYEDNKNLIFSTPLSSKVIRILDGDKFYYGDEWTSRTTITNQTQFARLGSGFKNSLDIICDPSFIFMQIKGTSYNIIVYIGALSNGDEVLMGMTTTSNVNINRFNNIINVTKNGYMSLVTLDEEFSNKGKLFKQEIYVKSMDNEVIMDGNAPANLLGVESVSFVADGLSSYKLSNHFISSSDLHVEGGKMESETSLLVGFS